MNFQKINILFNSCSTLLNNYFLCVYSAKRQEMNRIKAQLDGARSQNRRLQSTRDDLQDTVNALNASQEKIDGIVRSGGETQENFIQLIIKNHKLIKKMKSSFKKSVLEDLKQIVLKKDKDGDFILDVAELKSLHNALRTFRVETGPFKVFQANVTKNGNDLSHVLKIVGNYLDEKEDQLDRRTSNFSGRFDDLLHQYEAFKKEKNIA